MSYTAKNLDSGRPTQSEASSKAASTSRLNHGVHALKYSSPVARTLMRRRSLDTSDGSLLGHGTATLALETTWWTEAGFPDLQSLSSYAFCEKFATVLRSWTNRQLMEGRGCPIPMGEEYRSRVTLSMLG